MDQVRDGVFRNKNLGVSVKKPDGWHAFDKQERKEFQDVGVKIMSGDSIDEGTLREQLRNRTKILFTFSKYPPGALRAFNPVIAGVAEDISMHTDDIQNGCDYLDKLAARLKQSGMDYETDGGCKTVSANKKIFGLQKMTLTTWFQSVRQKYFARRKVDRSAACHRARVQTTCIVLSASRLGV